MYEETIPRGLAGENLYDCEPGFARFLEARFGRDGLAWAQDDLHHVGALAGGPMQELAWLADRNPPSLELCARDGTVENGVRFHPAYQELKRLAYNEAALVARVYDPTLRREHAASLRGVGFAVGFLFAHAEQGLFCPVCLTDGTARILEAFGSEELQQRWMPGLTAKDGDPPVQGAMFLTERQGGSDVGANALVATAEGEHWRLAGDKWFCSNAEADVALVLARTPDSVPGTRGLGLFAVPRVDDGGQANGQTLLRLKDKLGTRSMPTGEIRYDGAQAFLVGQMDQGFKHMTEMLNLSRLYNSVASVAIMRHGWLESWAYARERRAFGAGLMTYPLVRDLLVQMGVELEGAMHLVWDVIEGMAGLDGGEASEEDRVLWRVLTPLAKYSTARQAVRFASEAIEVLGGNGYIEEWPTARLLRDAQVLPVWEGTTNILVQDVFRVFAKEKGHEVVLGRLSQKITALDRDTAALETHLTDLQRGLADIAGLDPLAGTVHMRPWCDALVRLWQAVRLAEHAGWGEREEFLARTYQRRVLQTAPQELVEPARRQEIDALDLLLPA